MADPDGNEPVPFDDATADALTEAFDAAADDLDAQTTSRASLVTTASTDFRGLFSELFASNADTARQGASNLAECLRTVASFAGDLKQAAKEENTRRRLAREWQQRMDDRNGVEVVLQDIFGKEPPPRGEQKAAPVMPPVDVSVGSRETPAPGSGGGGGGGTSSARPDDLRSFATGSVGLNAQFSGRPGELDGKLADFASQCEWGAIDASGVTSALATWLTDNDTDVAWANTVAGAFESAGSSSDVSTVSDYALALALQTAGVQGQRSDLAITPPQGYGFPPTTGFTMDPVNTTTGNFLETEVDLAFADSWEHGTITNQWPIR